MKVLGRNSVMKKSIIIFASVLMALCGCSKNSDTVSTDNLVVKYLNVASFKSDLTKVSFSGENPDDNTVSFVWEEGDKVSFVHLDEEEEPDYYVDFECVDPSTGAFVKCSGQPDLDPSESYSVMYPDFMTFAESVIEEDEYVEYTQEYRADNIPAVHLMESEETSGSSASFTLNHTPIIHLQLCGTATVGKIVYLLSEDEDRDAMYCGESGVALKSNEATDFYLSLNSGFTSEDGFTIEVYDCNDQLLISKKSGMDMTDEKYDYNVIIDMPVINIR